MPPEGYSWSDFIDVSPTMDDMRADYERQCYSDMEWALGSLDDQQPLYTDDED